MRAVPVHEGGSFIQVGNVLCADAKGSVSIRPQTKWSREIYDASSISYEVATKLLIEDNHETRLQPAAG
jgi:regulator of RNase E activity RraA